MERDEASKTFVSTIIPQSETICWKVHNVSELLSNNAWTCCSIPFEVGWGPTSLSKWEVNLHGNEQMLEARAALLVPSEGEKVTHHLTIWIQRNGAKSLVKHPKEFQKAKETSFGGEPTFWKIIPMEELDSIKNEDEDSLELELKLTVFGSDLSQE